MSPSHRPWSRFALPAPLAFGLALSGCATGSPGDATEPALTDSAPPSVSPAPSTPSASPSASAVAPSVSFAFEEAPVVTRELTGVDERYINPGAVIDDDGTLHMFANLFTNWPGRVSVVHLRSTDDVEWALAEPDPVLTRDDVPFARTGIDVSTGFIDASGQWVLIFETVENSVPWVLGRATAPGPDGPWTVDPAPILEAGSAGEWDAGGLSWPSVVATDGGFAMYYTGLDRPRGTGAIGLATSTDGAVWTKHEGPVLTGEATWELRRLDRPRVAITPRGLVMVYAGGQLTDRGIAWSDDGVTWRRDGEAPVIEQAGYPAIGQAWDAALLSRDGRLLYYLEIGITSEAGTQVYLATASIP